MHQLNSETAAAIVADLKEETRALVLKMQAIQNEVSRNTKLIEALVQKYDVQLIGPKPACVSDSPQPVVAASLSASNPKEAVATLYQKALAILPGIKGDFSPTSLFEKIQRQFPIEKLEKALIYPVVRKLSEAKQIAQVQKGLGKRPALYRHAEVVDPFRELSTAV